MALSPVLARATRPLATRVAHRHCPSCVPWTSKASVSPLHCRADACRPHPWIVSTGPTCNQIMLAAATHRRAQCLVRVRASVASAARSSETGTGTGPHAGGRCAGRVVPVSLHCAAWGAAAAGAAHSCDGIPRASSHTIMTSGASGPALNRKLKMGRSQAPIRAGFNGERPSSSPRAQRKVSGCTGPRVSPRGPDLWNFEGSRWRVHNKRGFLQLRILCTVPPVYVHTAKYSTRRALRQNKQGCTGAHKSSAPPPPLA